MKSDGPNTLAQAFEVVAALIEWPNNTSTIKTKIKQIEPVELESSYSIQTNRTRNLKRAALIANTHLQSPLKSRNVLAKSNAYTRTSRDSSCGYFCHLEDKKSAARIDQPPAGKRLYHHLLCLDRTAAGFTLPLEIEVDFKRIQDYEDSYWCASLWRWFWFFLVAAWSGRWSAATPIPSNVCPNR